MRKPLPLVCLALAVTTASVVLLARPVRSNLGADGVEGVSEDWSPTAADYIQDGLIALWDGIENAGFGVHDESTTIWVDAVGDADLLIPSSAVWSENSLVIDRNSTVGASTDISGTLFYSQFCDAVDARILTVENYWSMPSYGTNAGSGLNYSVRRVIGPYPLRIFGWLCPISETDIYFNSSGRGLGYYWLRHGGFSTVGTHGMAATYSPDGASEERIFGCLYFDGLFVKSGTLPTSAVSDESVSFANLKHGSWHVGQISYKNSVPEIHCVRIYNRKLSHDEIAYNHNIDKARFGL